MLGVHKSISLPQSTEYAKEMIKWEAFPSQWGHPGRPFVQRDFPVRLYKALADRTLEGVTCQDERDLPNFLSRGFHETQAEALAAHDRMQADFGKLAAERNWEIQHGRISEHAAAEVRAAEAEHGARHLPMVPETPIPVHRKRGRKPKIAVPA